MWSLPWNLLFSKLHYESRQNYVTVCMYSILDIIYTMACLNISKMRAFSMSSSVSKLQLDKTLHLQCIFKLRYQCWKKLIIQWRHLLEKVQLNLTHLDFKHQLMYSLKIKGSTIEDALKVDEDICKEIGQPAINLTKFNK